MHLSATTNYKTLSSVVLQPPVDSTGRLTPAPHQLVHFGYIPAALKTLFLDRL